MIENIVCNATLMAIIIRAGFKQNGITFFTPGEFSQQLGYMNRPKGYVIDILKEKFYTHRKYCL